MGNGQRRGIPWSLGVNEEVMTEYTGVKLGDYYQNPALMLDVQLKARAILCTSYGYDMSQESVAPTFTAYVPATTLGLRLVFPEDEVPMPAGPALKSLGDIKRLVIADDLTTVGLMPRVIEAYLYMRDHLDADMPLGIPCTELQGPFTTAVLLRGSAFFTDLYDNPALAHRLLAIITANDIRLIETIDHIVGRKRDFLHICDDFSGLLSPPMYEEFVLPYYDKLFTALGVTKRVLHSELLKHEHLPLLSLVGITRYDAGTNQYLSITDLKETLDFPFRLQFKTSADLLLSTPADIKRKYRQMVEEGAMEMGVELCRRIPPENIIAFIEVAREYE